MSRRNEIANRIRGPQSALTDFLASNNISAAQIRRDYSRRVAEAEAANAAEGQDNETTRAETEDAVAATIAAEIEDEEIQEERASKRRKEDKQAAAIQKVKANKKTSKAKAKEKERLKRRGEISDSDDEFTYDAYAKSKPLPGQLDNCEICAKRFTVTPYSKEGPGGGLLCAKCSKEADAEKKKDQKAKKSAEVRERRRKLQSNLLDGVALHGARSLQEMCVQKVMENIDGVEELGELPQPLMYRLSQILSKFRVLTPKTLSLFTRPDFESIDIFDAGKLETDDFNRIFAISQGLKKLNLRAAGQFKDVNIDYIIDKNIPLTDITLDATNLVTDAKWRQFFRTCGHRIESLRLSWLDSAFDDETVRVMVENCPNLTRLKLKKCYKLTNDTLEHLKQFTKLEHLSLLFIKDLDPEPLNELVTTLGPRLKTLSLERYDSSDDTLLSIIQTHCNSLEKLRLTSNYLFSDAGLTSLFENWSNPPLRQIDLSSNRDLDCSKPDGPEDPIGLASSGFKALMAHSGQKLVKLNVASCRHISHEALTHVFDGKKKYPELEDIDVSFLANVDTLALAGLFKSCPKITKVVAFGCFGVKDINIPRGVALIGIPNAQDEIVQEGKGFGDFDMMELI